MHCQNFNNTPPIRNLRIDENENHEAYPQQETG